MSGATTAASGQKTLGRVFSLDARRRGEDAATALPDDVEVGAEGVELREELLVAAADDPDVADDRLALGRERRDQVAVAAAQVGHLDVGAVQRRRAR